jgi:hypothetical protein
MLDTFTEAEAWLDRFFDTHQRHRPVDATFMGVHGHDAELPDLSEQGAGDTLADVEALLAEIPESEGHGAEALDLRLAEGFLRGWRWELTGDHFHRGNPSLYTGEAVFGFLSLFLGHGGPLPHRVDAAARRLDAVPELLAQGREAMRSAPPAWTERAMRECEGALELFGDGVDALAEDLGLDSRLWRGPADRAARAVAEQLVWLDSELLRRPVDDVAAGDEGLDLALRHAHFLHEPADDIVAYAEAEMDQAAAWLREHAADFGADSPEEALAGLEDVHPDLDGYLRRYGEIWDSVRSLAEREGLLTWPAFPIRYVPRPRWVRAAAPYLYFLFYRSPAAYHRPPVHDYLVTPIDETLPVDEREALLRAHNDAVIRGNHVIHHGGIGHHVQNWHAFRAESRVGRVAAVDCAARIAMPCGGTMAEGWACYATDLVAEVGGLPPLEAYAERHSRVRMCARAVVDLQLHRGRMTLSQAASYYAERAGMSEAAARAESVKNSMFPGGAVMYLAGTDTIHDLRREMSAARGADFDLGTFHDDFLSYGSVPVRLIREDMLRREAHEEQPHAE